MSRVKLGDVAREHKETCKTDKSSYPIVGLEHLTPREIQLTGWDETSENTFTKMFRKGHMLFGRRRAYLKKAALAPFDGICSGDITVIEAIPDRILPDLLPFIIQNDDLFDFAVGRSAGSLSPRVKWEHLRNYEFELPDLADQRQLAEVLWAFEETKTGYKRLISATNELIKSQFVEMFGTIKNNIYGYPIGTIEDAAHDIYAGGDKPTDTSDTPTDTYRYPVYSNGETDCGLLCYAKTYRTTKIAITVSARGTIGFCAIREPLFTPVVRLITVEPKDGMDIRYLFTAIDQMQLVSTGTSQGQLTVPNFKKMPIILPPTEAQKQFASFAEQLDKSKFAAKQALSDLEEMQKALMLRHLG